MAIFNMSKESSKFRYKQKCIEIQWKLLSMHFTIAIICLPSYLVIYLIIDFDSSSPAHSRFHSPSSLPFHRTVSTCFVFFCFFYWNFSDCTASLSSVNFLPFVFIFVTLGGAVPCILFRCTLPRFFLSVIYTLVFLYFSFCLFIFFVVAHICKFILFGCS